MKRRQSRSRKTKTENATTLPAASSHWPLSLETIIGGIFLILSLFVGIDVPLSFIQQPSVYSKGLSVGASAAALFLLGLWLLSRQRVAPEKN